MVAEEANKFNVIEAHFFFSSYDGLSTPNLSCSSGPTNGRPAQAAN
jgi:hypothetical protein